VFVTVVFVTVVFVTVVFVTVVFVTVVFVGVVGAIIGVTFADIFVDGGIQIPVT
jgi:hypothetical protein